MGQSEDTKTDIWHRNFCPWMRNKWFLACLYIPLLLLVVILSGKGVYLATTTTRLLSTSKDLGLPPFLLYAQLAVGIIGVISLLVIMIAFLRQQSNEAAGWVFLMFIFEPMRLVDLTLDTIGKNVSRSNYLFSWWTETSIAWLITIALISLACYIVVNITKHRNFDHIPI